MTEKSVVEQNVECLCCHGSGVQHCTVKSHFSDGKRETEHYDLDCMWCDGKGTMTAEEEQEYHDNVNEWCKCRTKGKRIYRKRGGTIDTYCGTCNKLLVCG